jgi:hypothetical protein
MLDKPSGSREFHAAIDQETTRMRRATLTRWSLWTLAAALPLGCAAAFVLARRGRRAADDYEHWWQSRERLRNGNHAAFPQDRLRRDELFV